MEFKKSIVVTQVDTFDVNNIKSFLKEYDQKKIFIDQLNDILQNTHNALNVK